MAKLTEEQKAERARARRLNEALAAEADHERIEARRRAWEEKGMRLTWEEVEAGVLCRGCGLPILDGRGSWPWPKDMTEAERAEHEAADADYRSRHPDCRSHRWSVSGSRTTHCGYCCPPHPMSPAMANELGHLLRSILSRKPDARELNTWRLTLTCDHVVQRTQHRDHQTWTTRVVECQECCTHRGVICADLLPDSERTGHDEPVSPEHDAVQRAAAERELKKLRSQSAKLHQRIEELERVMQ